MTVHAWLTNTTPCTDCGHPRNAHGRIAAREVRTLKKIHWRCARCSCHKQHWMDEVEMCSGEGCVLATGHLGDHATRRVSMLACPHNVPNFGPPCVICDQLWRRSR